ncbi:MAG: hypothetical protein IAE95_01240 [Chitinophagaceae bacterium]|nr:hypothetical protein [Chitinophagaceae bacterium]
MKTTKFILISFLLLSGCRKEKERICDVYASQQAYSIGTVESYEKTSMKVTYKYSYSANGTTYTGIEKAYGIGQLDETMIKRKFVVVYKRDNPSESDLNTNYEVREPVDFNKFVSDFKIAPAKPDYPRKNCK